MSQTAVVRLPLHRQLVNFTSSTAGLEKALRLIQALAQVGTELVADNVLATRCSIAASQIALGRRYFRLLDFLECFENVRGLLSGDIPSRGSFISLLETQESTCLGIYLLLENLTILHDMSVWLVPWYTPILVEANKFWVYAIGLSLVRAVCELYTLRQRQGDQSEEKTAQHPQVTHPTQAAILKRVVVDSCDLLLPGSATGWIPAGDLAIGVTMVISTILVSQDLWDKARR